MSATRSTAAMPSMREGIVAAVAVLLTAAPATAEVADKEPTLAQVWGWALGGMVLGFILSRVWKPALLLSLLLALFVPVSALLDCMDRSVGPAIRRELGMSYVLGVLGAVVVAVLAHLALLLIPPRKRTRSGAVPGVSL